MNKLSLLTTMTVFLLNASVFAAEIILKKETAGGLIYAIKDGPVVCRLIIGAVHGSLDCKIEGPGDLEANEMKMEIPYMIGYKDTLHRQVVAERTCYLLSGIKKSAISCL